MGKSPEAARAWVAKVMANPDDQSNAAKVCRAVLTREPFQVDKLAEMLNVSMSTAYVAISDMRKAGYPIEAPRQRGPHHPPPTYQLTGAQQDAPYVSESIAHAALVRVERGVEHVANGRSSVKLPAAFLRPPPDGLPALGEVLRVAMLAEADGGEAVVLQGADGRRYFLHVEAS